VGSAVSALCSIACHNLTVGSWGEEIGRNDVTLGSDNKR
jgi:hypothetical protein